MTGSSAFIRQLSLAQKSELNKPNPANESEQGSTSGDGQLEKVRTSQESTTSEKDEKISFNSALAATNLRRRKDSINEMGCEMSTQEQLGQLFAAKKKPLQSFEAAPHTLGWVPSTMETVGVTLGCYLCLMCAITYFTDTNTTLANGKAASESHGHEIAAIAFMVAAMICVQAVWWAGDPVKRSIALWVFHVNMCSSITYGYFFLFGEPTIPTLSGDGTTGCLRYLQWAFTTPAMVMCLSRLTERSASADRLLREAVISDVIMVATGFLERYLPWPYNAIAFIASTAAFVLVLYHLYELFSIAGRELSVPAQKRLDYLYMYTLVMWMMFPIVRLLALGGAISRSSEEISFITLDLATKLVYAISLMQLNHVVIDTNQADRLGKLQKHLHKEIRQKKRSIDRARTPMAVASEVAGLVELAELAVAAGVT